MNDKTKKIREMTEENMKKEMTDLLKEIRNQRAQISTGNPPKSVSKLKRNKRQIARILTIINENKKKGGDKKKK